MPKTATAEPETPQKDQIRQQRKKQAKQEAKLMLKIEQAKKGLKKAEKKLTRAQSSLDENQTHLHKLEEKLQQIRTPEGPQAPDAQTPSEVSSEVQPEVSDGVYQEPLLASETSTPETDTAIASKEGSDNIPSDQELPLTQAESDVTSYPSHAQDTPSPEAVAETDTTTPEEDQSLVEQDDEVLVAQESVAKENM